MNDTAKIEQLRKELTELQARVKSLEERLETPIVGTGPSLDHATRIVVGSWDKVSESMKPSLGGPRT